jgi:hypothetical protein
MLADSSRIALLYRVSELARRYGLRPSEAAATFEFVFDGPEDKPEYFRLSFDNLPTDLDARDKFVRMKTALGCEGNHLIADEMSEIEDRVERAIAHAPRLRTL